MKSHRLILWCAVTVAVTSFTSCTQTTKGEVTPLSFTATLPAAAGTPPYETGPIASTKPVIADPSTPVPTNTQIPIPTLELEKADEFLQDLLTNNGACGLPCLWGIVPGQSTYQEVRALLEPLRGISEYPTIDELNAEGGSMDFINVQGEFQFDTHIAYLTEGHIVTSISFRLSMDKMKIDPSNGEYWIGVYDSNLFSQRFQLYTLSGVLSKLGHPEAVVISTDGGPARGRNVPGFYLLLVYPEQGVLVRYTTFRELVGENVRGCLTNAHAEFELFPSGQADLFSNNVDSTDWANWWPVPDDSPYWKSIETAASISVQDFYEDFRQPTDKCLETPANIWYLPG
jgi:hypothetical protein